MYGRLLVPLDGSPAAEAALDLAVLIPSRTLRLLRVVPADDTAGYAWEAALQADTWRGEREARAGAYLTRLADRLCERGHAAETVVAAGSAAEAIVDAARTADLIVMATGGRGAHPEGLFGSVADRVARHAPVSTLVVRAGRDPVPAPPLTRIVVPLDGSPLAEWAVPEALRIGSDLSLPIRLVRVVDVPSLAEAFSEEPDEHAIEVERRAGAAYLEAQAARLRQRVAAVDIEVRVGPAPEQLLAAIRPGDLVVMTTHGRGGLRRWLLGGVADKLVRLAAAPTLLVRVGAAAAGALPGEDDRQAGVAV